jgi:hypothetical protein
MLLMILKDEENCTKNTRAGDCKVRYKDNCVYRIHTQTNNPIQPSANSWIRRKRSRKIEELNTVARQLYRTFSELSPPCGLRVVLCTPSQR